MSSSSHAEDPVAANLVQDPAGDAARHEQEEPHDHATEVAHAWDHFYENARFFGGFLTIILLTFLAFNINFGKWNLPVELFLAAIRSAFIAYFLASLFKSFSLVFRTLFFTAIFLAGMIFLSLWDSEVRGIGNPIKDDAHPESQEP